MKALYNLLTHATAPVLYGLLGQPCPCNSLPVSLLPWCFLMALRTSDVSALSDTRWCKTKGCSLVSKAADSSSLLFYSHSWPDVLTRKLRSVLRGTKRTLTKATFKELGSLKEEEIIVEEDEIWEEHSKELVRSGQTPWSQPRRGAHTLHLISSRLKAV